MRKEPDSGGRQKARNRAREVWPELDASAHHDLADYPGLEVSELAPEHLILKRWLSQPRQQELRGLVHAGDSGAFAWSVGRPGAEPPLSMRFPAGLLETPTARARAVLALDERVRWMWCLEEFIPTDRSRKLPSPADDALWLKGIARTLDRSRSLFRLEEAAIFLRFQERLRRAGAERSFGTDWPPLVRILRPLRTTPGVPWDVVAAYANTYAYFHDKYVRFLGTRGLSDSLVQKGLGPLLIQINERFGIRPGRGRFKLYDPESRTTTPAGSGDDGSKPPESELAGATKETDEPRLRRPRKTNGQPDEPLKPVAAVRRAAVSAAKPRKGDASVDAGQSATRSSKHVGDGAATRAAKSPVRSARSKRATPPDGTRTPGLQRGKKSDRRR
jgi:hypothetical protein